MSTREWMASLLILFGILTMVRPLLNWAVLGDASSGFMVPIGAAFVIGGILVLMWGKDRRDLSWLMPDRSGLGNSGTQGRQ